MFQINIQKIMGSAVSLLYPYVCPGCGRILSVRKTSSERTVQSSGQLSAKRRNPYICPACYARISFPKEPRCLCCSRPLEEEEEEFCYDCGRKKKHFDAGTSLMLHDEISRKILYDLKYYNKRDNARMLAYEAVLREGQRVLSWKPDVVIPVPLHKKRQQTRGFNQAQLLAEWFCVYLKELTEPQACRTYGICGAISLPVDPRYLIRAHKTKAQKELTGDQRRENVRNAFSIRDNTDPARYAGKTILLVDDIYTSGATLSECARVLKLHGAGQVYCLTFGMG